MSQHYKMILDNSIIQKKIHGDKTFMELLVQLFL